MQQDKPDLSEEQEEPASTRFGEGAHADPATKALFFGLTHDERNELLHHPVHKAAAKRAPWEGRGPAKEPTGC